MESIVRRNQKKKLLFAIGVLLFIVATIIIGIYTTNRTDANQLSNGVSAPEEADMRIDVKVDSGLVEPQATTSVTEADVPASSDGQQAVTNETNSNVEVRVDGTSIDVPEDGSVHKVINTENGKTTIDFSTQSNTSSGDSRTRSSVNVDFDSDSSVRIRN